MRGIIFILIAYLLNFTNYSNAQLIKNWKLISKSGQGGMMISDSLHFGYFVDGISDSVYLTSDGGKNWDETIIYQNKDSFSLRIRSWNKMYNKYIYCLADESVNRGWDNLGNELVDYKANIIKSSDRGKSWQRIPINNKWRSRPSTKIYMSDSLNGIIVQLPSIYEIEEKSALIYFTNDGWKTWQLIKSPNDLKACYYAYFSFPKTIVTATIGFWKIYKTTDLGKSWAIKSIPDSMIIKGSALTILNSNTYFFSKLNKLYRTTNSGDEWNIFYFNDEPVGKLNFRSDSLIFLSGEHPKYISLDGQNIASLNNSYYNNFENRILDIYKFSNNIIIANSQLGIVKYDGSKYLQPPTFTVPDSSSNRPLNFLLKWTPIEGASKYHLQVVERIGNPMDSLKRIPPTYKEPLFVDDSIIFGTTYQLTGTSNYKEYNCRIRAFNDTISSPWLSKVFWTQRTTKVKEESNYKEINLKLFLVYPNPIANKIINLDFNLKNNSKIKIDLINSLGIKVGKTYSEYFDVGSHTIRYIPASNLPSGTYWLRMIINNKETIVKPVVVVR